MKTFHLLAYSASMKIDCILPEKELYRQLKSIHRLHIQFTKIANSHITHKNEGKLNVFIRQCNINTGPNVENVPGENRNVLQSAATDNGNV